MLLALAFTAEAEPRWCSVTGRGPNDKFIYPPIARVARVSGVVLGRLEFLTNGKVVDFNPGSGPRLLADSIKAQLSPWTLQTDATGGEGCQALVIAEFDEGDSGPQDSTAKITYEPGSVLRIRTM